MMCTNSTTSIASKHIYSIYPSSLQSLYFPIFPNMGKILEILFFLITTFSTVHANNQNVCPTSSCGDLSIRYPFKQQNTQPQNNCSYINLTCNGNIVTNQTAILSLPNAGIFNVRYIGYYSPNIKLYDPENCLMRRLMNNLNLSSSPFRAVGYENYTFYTCPSEAGIIGYYVLPIVCLSNNTNTTVATSITTPEYMSLYGCEVIGSWLLPVLGPGQFEFDGINGDLYLTWDSKKCRACEDQNDQQGDQGDSKGNSWDRFAVSPYFIPSFVTFPIILAIFLLAIGKSIARRNENNSDSTMADATAITSATAPPQSTTGGLDESKINSCTELVVLGESRINAGPDFNTCSICLESYHPQELLRSIAKCGHCFHADCIELWLRKSSTCPVCRTNISDIDL